MNSPCEPRVVMKLVGVAAALAYLAVACSAPTLELRARILDEQGNPVSNSVFYAEAWSHSECFDFAFARAGERGEVPPAGQPPLTIRWKTGAVLAIAAFAPDRKPEVVYDELGRVRADGIALYLEDLKSSEREWEPRLAHLGFPFPANPKLSGRLADAAATDLCRAFAAAYAALEKEAVILPAEQAKRAAVEQLTAVHEKPSTAP